MQQKLLKFTYNMFKHIESFQKHFNIATFSEAVRQLILDGFKFNGCPLDESARMPMGRVARESAEVVNAREQREHQERYENLMRQLGHEP